MNAIGLNTLDRSIVAARAAKKIEEMRSAKQPKDCHIENAYASDLQDMVVELILKEE